MSIVDLELSLDKFKKTSPTNQTIFFACAVKFKTGQSVTILLLDSKFLCSRSLKVINTEESLDSPTLRLFTN